MREKRWLFHLFFEVSPHSPAAKAGLRRGDIIVRYGNDEIEEATALRNLIADTPINKKKIHVMPF